MILIQTLLVAFSLAVCSDAFVVPRPVVGPHYQHVLFMGWGPEPIWSQANVVANDVACTSGACVSIAVDVGNTDITKEYTIPGQYVQLRLNEETKPLFLAISSPPNGESCIFEFLVKKTDTNEWLTDASIDTAVQVSQVLGGGFPIEENLNSLKYDFPTQNVMLFAVGSGIAPIKAAIESGQLRTGSNGGGRSARVYYGERTPGDLCFTDHFARWEAAGVEVVPVLSQPPSSWGGRSGYVQNALEEDGVPIPRNSGALLCGMKGMAESVKDVLLKAGVFEGRVLTNF
jgi:NAD(P)H-flavin reductase